MDLAENERPEGAGKRHSGQTDAFDSTDFSFPLAEPQDSSPTSKLEWALWNARRFGRVFPVIPGEKNPAIKDNLRRATRDEAQIRAWFTDALTGRSNDCNIGLVCDGGEDGCTVVDLDPKNNPNILADFDVRMDIWDAQPTFVVAPPGGGRHHYFHTAEPIGSGAHTNKYLEGLDTRGAGAGYVLAVGSTRRIQIDQHKSEIRTYSIVNDAPIARMPEALENALRGAPPSSDPPVGDAAPMAELDQPHNVALAVDCLKSAKAPHVGNRNERTNRVAFRVGDFSISQPLCIDLMAEHWLPKCPGDWAMDDMLPPIHSAYTRRRTRLGSGTPEAQFPPIEEAPPALSAQAGPTVALAEDEAIELPEISEDYGYRVVDFGDEDDFSTFRDPLVNGVLDQKTIGLFYGKSHVGKSFVLVHLAWHIAAGEPWGGQFLTQGPVLYVSTEDDEGILLRKAALRKVFGTGPVPLRFVNLNISLGTGGDKAVRRIVKEARLLERKVGQPPILVVVDTISATMMNMDVNGGGDISALIHRLRQISVATGAACLGVGHTGKNEDNGPLGSYLFTANVDFQVQVRAGEIEVQKKRNGKKAPPFGFALDDIDLGRTVTGQPLSSAVARILDRPEVDASVAERELRSDPRDLLRLARDLARHLDLSQESVGLTVHGLAEEAVARKIRKPGKTPKNTQDSVQKTLKRLEAVQLMKYRNGLWLPTEFARTAGWEAA